MTSHEFGRSRPSIHRMAPYWALVILLCLGAGCGSNTESTSTPPTRVAATATTLPATPSGPVATTTAQSEVLRLTWWTPEFISPQAGAPAGPLLSGFIDDFEAAHAGGITVAPVVKARYGKGGLLDLLRTAQPVAPGALPDFVTLDASELELAANLDLPQPLEGLFGEGTLTDLFPFALQAGQFGERLLGVQYLADIHHLAYLRNRVSVVPSTWEDFLAGNKQYLFPVHSPQPSATSGAQEDIQNSFVSQYLSAGGIIDGKTHQLLLEEQPLFRVLTFYLEARTADLLPVEASSIGNLDETWTEFVQGIVPLADVSARRYLAEYQKLRNIGYAQTPGWSAPAPAVTTGWVFAIITPDPARQQAAAQFLTWLLEAQRNGAWTAATGWLPVSSSALTTWEADPYIAFLDEQLAAAHAHPGGPDYTQTASRIHRAVVSVLDEGVEPVDAARSSLEAPK